MYWPWNKQDMEKVKLHEGKYIIILYNNTINIEFKILIFCFLKNIYIYIYYIHIYAYILFYDIIIFISSSSINKYFFLY